VTGLFIGLHTPRYQFETLALQIELWQERYSPQSNCSHYLIKTPVFHHFLQQIIAAVLGGKQY